MHNDLLDLRTIQMLNKLLKAAQKAHSDGKEQALSKIIHTASRLSAKLNESSDARTNLDEFDIFNDEEMINTDYYTKVEGILVD